MKKITKLIVAPLLTIVVCVAMIAGSTFALFTSESSTVVTVTSGRSSYPQR